jgi:fatty acid desaturase
MVTTLPTPVSLRNYVNRRKPLWNWIAILYVFLGYVGGVGLLMPRNGWLNGLGIIFLTHSLLYSAYLSHELMHGTIFKSRRWNASFGKAMLWLNGGCYNGFEALSLQHIAHHVDRVDVFTFDPVAALQKLPQPIRQILLILEWLYFPIMGFWSRWRSILSPWWNPQCRERRVTTALILAIRIAMFALLGLISLRALLLYSFAYIGMMTIMRWADCFQHTYEGFPPGTKLPKRDRLHEETNTFSTLFSRRYPWLNLLLLNFGYHSAHHAVMKCPWHSLPELDRELYPDSESQDNPVRYISLARQLSNYHRFRVTRFLQGQGQAIDDLGRPSLETFYGAHDVSFLMLY